MKVLKSILTIGFFFALAFIVYKEIQHYKDQIPSLIRETDLAFVPLLLLLQITGYFFNAVVSQLILKILHIKTSVLKNIEIGIGNELGNKMAPVIGGMVASYFSYVKVLNIEPVSALFLTTIWTLLLLIHFPIFIVASAIALPSNLFPHQADVMWILFIAILIASWALYNLSKNNGKKIIKITLAVLRFLNKAGRFFGGKGINLQKAATAVPRMYEDIKKFFKNKKIASRALALSFLYYACDIAILYFSFRAFHFMPNLALLVFGFVLSSFLALIVPDQATPGVSEAAHFIGLIILGFPPHVVLFAVLLYRIITYWIWIPFSFIYFLRLRKLQKRGAR